MVFTTFVLTFNKIIEPIKVTFSKPRKKVTLRKRDEENFDEESVQIIKKAKMGNEALKDNGIVATSKGREDNIREELLNYQSSGKEVKEMNHKIFLDKCSNKGSFFCFVVKYLTPRDGGATLTKETETDQTTDDRAIRDRVRKEKEQEEPQILTGEDAEKAEKIYRGTAAYREWVERKEATGLSKGAGIKQGPIRLNVHIRSTAPFDYDPSICKDYMLTGYCSYGDSCKYVHDRGDYKSGWELERDWDAKQKGKLKPEQNLEIHEEEEVPFLCPICNKLFVNPVQTKCNHIFCERCALKWFKTTIKCRICGRSTGGAFKTVDKKMREKLDRRREKALESGEYAGDNNEDDNENNEVERRY